MERKENKLLQGIDTTIVRVSNIEAAKTWYQDKLGLSSVWDNPTSRLVVLDAGGSTSITLWQTDKPITINKDIASYPIFRTPDAAALRQELQNREVATGEVIQDDHVQYFFFYDPDGNVLEACQGMSNE